MSDVLAPGIGVGQASMREVSAWDSGPDGRVGQRALLAKRGLVVDHWTDFGVRRFPSLSARRRFDLPPPLEAFIAARTATLEQPLRGITSDGAVRAGLFELRSSGVSTAPITDAALDFLGALSAQQRQRAVFPLHAEERRMWLNIHPFLVRHGVILEELSPPARQLGLRLLEASLSPRGYAQARDIMRLNRLLAEVTGFSEDYGEWPYFISFYGDPDAGRPWAWQIDGHHLCINGTVIDDQVVLTPSFMGSEPCHVFDGPLAGTMVFTAEEQTGLDLIRSLDDQQAARAVLLPSIHPDDLPPELQDPADGRMQAGAFRDNAAIPFAGICAADLTDGQRRRLRSLVASYVGWAAEGHSGVRMSEVDHHLDETYFAWMGAVAKDGPFYYRVHSPVVLIEFDHHPGVAFDNPVPSRNHIHTLIRTPNGGDYGSDLLRQHHERFDHSSGTHVARTG